MSDLKNQIQSASFVVPVLKLREPDPADVYTFLKSKAESAPHLFSGAPIIIDISELGSLPDLLRLKDAVGKTGFLLVGFTGIKMTRTGSSSPRSISRCCRPHQALPQGPAAADH